MAIYHSWFTHHTLLFHTPRVAGRGSRGPAQPPATTGLRAGGDARGCCGFFELKGAQSSHIFVTPFVHFRERGGGCLSNRWLRPIYLTGFFLPINNLILPYKWDFFGTFHGFRTNIRI